MKTARLDSYYTPDILASFETTPILLRELVELSASQVGLNEYDFTGSGPLDGPIWQTEEGDNVRIMQLLVNQNPITNSGSFVAIALHNRKMITVGFRFRNYSPYIEGSFGPEVPGNPYEFTNRCLLESLRYLASQDTIQPQRPDGSNRFIDC
jgi:hypothetical protein